MPLLAADYPFLDLFWSMIIFFAWLCWFWMIVVILSDIFRRRDIGGWAKAGWAAFLIIVPFVGALVYLIAQHDGMAERREGEYKAQQAAFDERVRSAAGADGPATEISNAKRLLDDGTIDEREFEQIKSRALAAH
jgi:hypothetical protein